MNSSKRAGLVGAMWALLLVGCGGGGSGGSSGGGASTPPSACVTNCSAGTLSTTHAAGNPATGRTYWISLVAAGGGACDACHGTPPSNASFSAAIGANGPYNTLAYYATAPANITTGLNATANAAMATYKAGAVANQDNLSAYFASLMTPVLTNPGNSTWKSGGAYSYQIGAPAATDYLVSTTTYAVTTSAGLTLAVNASGLVTGTLPTVATPTTYTVTLDAINAAATTTTGSVTYTITVQ